MNQFWKSVKSNLFPFIVFMILVVGCASAFYFFHPSSPYHERYTFVVGYQTIGTLSPGNLVRVRGIAKGQILKVELTDDAVFVKVEVLADSKISRNSEFRLVNAGLMGEREMNILTADDGDWIVDGDTVNGSFDDGLAGVGKVLLDAIDDVGKMKDMVVALKDSLTVGSTGKQIERIVKKGGRIVGSTKNLVNDTRSQVQEVVSRAEGALSKLKDAIDAEVKRGTVTVDAASALIERVDGLLSEVKELKADTDGLVARIGAEDNTVGLALKSDGPLIKKTEKLAADMDKLISDVKKRGLKINVDIF